MISSKKTASNPRNFTVHPEDWAVTTYAGEGANGLPHGSVAKPQCASGLRGAARFARLQAEILGRAYKRGCRDIPREAVASKSLELSHTGYIEVVQHKPGKGRVLLAGDVCIADAWHFSVSLLSSKSDIIPPLSAVIESYIDTLFDAKTIYFRCHLDTYMAYLAEYSKDAKDPGFPGMLRYKYQQDFWHSYMTTRKLNGGGVRNPSP